MYFRPFPVLTIIAVPALAALIALGVWQSQRAGWKAELITQFEQAAKADPLLPEAALCGQTPKPGEVVAPPQGVDIAACLGTPRTISGAVQADLSVAPSWPAGAASRHRRADVASPAPRTSPDRYLVETACQAADGCGELAIHQ
jgi:hypothetical protein